MKKSGAGFPVVPRPTKNIHTGKQMGETLDYINQNGEEPSDPEEGDFYRPAKYKHPVCNSSRAVEKNKNWKRKKRPCPCCGRMISSAMVFSTHGDQRKKNK